jgi:LysM repeat protein
MEMPDYNPLQACPPNTVHYTVKAGDTLYALARRYGTTVAAIEAANPGINPNRLSIGQPLCIPRQPVYPSCPGGDYYVVQRGDTLYAIAHRYSVSLSDLMRANPQADPNLLVIGQVLCIPPAPTTVRCPPNSYHYRIVPGDTMYGIAHRYGVNLNALLTLNNGVDPNALVPGEIICIPMA